MSMNACPFSTFVRNCNYALSKEIEAEKAKDNVITVNNGKMVDRNLYLFDTEQSLTLPDETPITIDFNSQSFSGKIINYIDKKILIKIDASVIDLITLAKINLEPWKILKELQLRLLEKEKNNVNIAEELACNGKNNYSNDPILTGQSKALSCALRNTNTIIWGPPGTGKTETLAKISLQSVNLGLRVLVVSHSNVSVDEAIKRIHKLQYECEGYKEDYRLLRYGYPRDMNILKDDYMTSFNQTLLACPNLAMEREHLLNRLRTPHSKNQQDVNKICSRLSEILKELKYKEHEVVENANLIATTISKVIIDKLLYESNNFDVVIFDEASMAYIPQVIFAATMAKKHMICIGDYCQLPPIVQSPEEAESVALLTNNIFYHIGIPQSLKEGHSHKWLVMLNTQYRMHPMIADTVNDFMYAGLLKTAPGVLKERNSITKSLPIKDMPIAIFDLSSMYSLCLQPKSKPSNSHFNILSAFISIYLATQSQDKSIGIITPYKAQAKLINTLLFDLGKKFEIQNISASTVHQFQGSERDIIIFDLTDCYRMSNAGILLTSHNLEQANKLLNVAITRARGKFILLLNLDYFKRKIKDKTLLLYHLLNILPNRIIDGQKYIERFETPVAELNMFPTQDGNIQSYYEDIAKATRSIRVLIPFLLSVQERQRLDFALLAAKKRGILIELYSENPQNKDFIVNVNITKDALNPLTIIDDTIVWYGLPFCESKFTLNSGQEIKTRFFPILRFAGERAIKLLKQYYLLPSNTVKVDPVKHSCMSFEKYASQTLQCSECKSPLKLSRGKSGKFYLSCSNKKCSHTELITKQLLSKYIYAYHITCPEDKTTLCPMIGKYGIFLKCNRGLHTFNVDKI